MKNLKLELFDFKKSLKFEQSDICSIVESHINALNDVSEMNVINSLNVSLSKFTYHDEVKTLLEGLNSDVESYELAYTLKDLFRLVEKRNEGGTIYRQPLNVILDIINTLDDQSQMNKIVNELVIYDWVPEVKVFMYNLTNSPETKQNLLSGGSANPVYTLVESVEGGHVAFINDSWFLLGESKIEKVLLEDHIKDVEKLKTMRTLESGLSYCEITEDRVNFKISENIVLGLSVDTPGITYINEDKLNTETTLDNLFQSPVIPIVNKAFFPLIKEMANNLNKFVELDVVRKVENLTLPTTDLFVFNYNENMYLYTVDGRYGNSFYKYESAIELIDDVKNEMNYDLTYFFENKLSQEVKFKKQLEDKVKEVTVDIDTLDKNIDKIDANIKLLGESKVLVDAMKSLNETKTEKLLKLDAIKALLYKEISKG